MMRKILFIPVLFIFLCSCIQEFDLKLDKLEKLVVVDGLITNTKGPYYVRLTRSSNILNSAILPRGLNGANSLTDNAEPVKNATVIIFDNAGNLDTLKPVPQFSARVLYIYDVNDNLKDSVFRPNYEDPYSINKGFYMTSHLQGVVGRYYNLKILVDGKEYHSQCYMPPLPKIDSVSYSHSNSELLKGQDVWKPIIYFKKPETNSFYLFRHNSRSRSTPTGKIILPEINSEAIWDFSIISTKFFDPYINALDVQIGTYIKPSGAYFHYSERVIYFSMNSITEETYAFYNSLISQYNNDGGAFKPTPSSPQGNISNGALGFFRASAVIDFKVNLPPL